MERAVALTIDYVRQREAFGKKIIEFQNTQFELAACKTRATVAKVFCDECIQRGLKGELDNATAAMASTDLRCARQGRRPLPAIVRRLMAIWTNIRSRRI